MSELGASEHPTTKINAPKDQLRAVWIAAVYLAQVVPLGPVVVIAASSIFYYRWRKAWPRKARTLNLHAWIATFARLGIWFFLQHRAG